MTNKTISTIDLNTADEDVLVKKLHISSRLAKRIISLRPYQSVEQLNKIWGIDPAILQRITPLVSVAQQEIIPALTVEETPVLPEIEFHPVEQEPKVNPQITEPKQTVSPFVEVQPNPPLPSPKARENILENKCGFGVDTFNRSLFSIYRIELGRGPASTSR